PSSATFKTAGGKVVKASLDEIYNGKTSIYLGADTNSYTLEVTMSQSTNIVEFKLLIGGKTAENGKVEFEFEVTDSGEVKLYRKGQRDDDGNKIPIPSEYATITLDPTTKLPINAFFAAEHNKKNPDGTNVKDENDEFVFEYKDGATYILEEKFLGETGTYTGTDENGNQSLKLVIDGRIKDYKQATFTYTDPTTNEVSTFSCIYTIENGKIKFFEDNRPMKQGWTKVEIGREVRYIQICYKDTEDYYGSTTSQAPYEVLIYGYATGSGDPIVDTTRTLPLIKDFMGACGFTAGGGGNTTPRQLECFGVLREYVNLGWVYTNAGFPKKAATIANSSMGDFDKNYGRDYAALTVIPCLQWNEGSNPARYYNRITGTLDISQIASEADKFKPETYAAYADVAYQYAARYGSSKMGYLYEAVATHSGGTPKVGLNYLQWIELGNEPNGEDQNGTTPYQLAALTSAAYDGHQRTILSDVWNGEDFTYFFGAKTADPDFKVAMAGLGG
ncbi:MAG: hypothetical protein II980_03460, partial [Clostridia bacterium]|nr:hypothetical protein [Clostridia bacterium]